MYIANQLNLKGFHKYSINLTTTLKQGLFVIMTNDMEFIEQAQKTGGIYLLLPETTTCFWVPFHRKLRLNERQVTIKCEND
jgi:hypothetical protein